MNTTKHLDTGKNIAGLGKQRSYSEVIEFLDTHWNISTKETSLEIIKKLDKLFGSPSQKLSTIIIEGTNGKSLTAHFATKLFKEEGFSVGTYYVPGILTYNERFCIDSEVIQNKIFTELANDIINAAEQAKITITSKELLTQMAFNYFSKNNVDVAILETTKGGVSDPVALCKPSIIAVTRITANEVNEQGQAFDTTLQEYLGLVQPGTHVLAADQNKANLKHMEELVTKAGAIWGMPVRKLVPLSYPFEQLHGRCGALAERIVATYLNECVTDQTMLLSASLVAKKKGQRGRPTLDAKRESELHPKRTLAQFWKETSNTLAGRFQILEKEKPTILLDTASNIDALDNFLLGIRLLHYNKALKGLTLVLAFEKNALDETEMLKKLRYFFKKTAGNVIVCPAPEGTSWDIEQVAEAMTALKIKARTAPSLKEAIEIAKKNVNERSGLVAITGSSTVVREYWNTKGIKKF